MRVWMVLLVAAACGVPTAFGQTGSGRKPKPASNPPAKTRASTSGAGSDRAHLLIPGVGGITRNRRPTTPVYGPPAPGQSPAVVPMPGLGPVVALPGLQSRPVNPMVYGVNVVWGDNGGMARWDKDAMAKARRLAQLLKSAGVTNTRIGIRWADVERVRGHYDWAETDRFAGFVSRLGVKIVCVVDTTPDWAVESSPSVDRLFKDKGVAALASRRAPLPAFYSDLGRFAFACASRYGDRIQRWEFWNEPDGMGMPIVVLDAAGKPVDIQYGGDPKVYADMLRAFSAGVKRADRQALVSVGGLQVEKTDFLTALYSNGARAAFDAVALHPYSYRKPIAFDWIDKCREIMLRNGDVDKGIWLTEWGWATSPGRADAITEMHQARLIRDSLAGIAIRPFVTQAVYNALCDWRANESDASTLVSAGLCSTALMPKAGYAAFREVATGMPRPIAAFHSISLAGPLAGADEGGVTTSPVEVTIDAARSLGAMPALAQGYAQGFEVHGAEAMQASAERLRGVGARLVRFDPFPDPSAVASADPVFQTSDAVPGAPEVRGIDWAYSDRIVRALASAGAKPIMCIGTMPTMLSSPIGNAGMPRSDSEWSQFVASVVRHYNVDQRAGIVYWELGNRPDDGSYTIPEYLRLYDVFARAVRSADPEAKVGGPSTTDCNLDWITALVEHCAVQSTPLDFVSWHAFGHSPADYARQVREVRSILGRHPALRNVGLVLSEWNGTTGISPANDSVAGALHVLTVAEELAAVEPVTSLFYSVREGADYRDPSARFTGRWGMLAHDGTPKPVFNAFRLLSMLSGDRIDAGSDDSDVYVLGSRAPGHVRALFWLYPFRGTASAPSSSSDAESDRPASIVVRGLPWSGPTKGTLWLLDERHGNARMGIGQAELRPAGSFDAPAGDMSLGVVLPRSSACLIDLVPESVRSVDASLSTPRYVVYGGSVFPMQATLTNRGQKPIVVTPKLLCSDSALLSGDTTRTRPTRIAAAGKLTVQYAVSAPISRADGQEVFTVTAGDSASSLAVKFVTPIRAHVDRLRSDVHGPDGAPDTQASSASFDVTLDNRATTAMMPKIVYGKTAETITIKPRSSVTRTVHLPAPRTQPGDYASSIGVYLGDRQVQEIGAVVGVPALCRHTVGPVRVNGDLTEWANAYGLVLDQAEQVHEKSWGGPSDLSARAMTMWDEKNLYVAVSVTDDVNYQPYPPERMTEGDSVQFSVQPDRDAVRDDVGSSNRDHVFGISAGPVRPVVFRFAGPPGRVPGVVRAADIAVRRSGGLTIYEAAIPWTELSPAGPKDGSLVGFSVRVNDNDGKGRGYIESTGGMGATSDDGRFIGLRLVR